MRNYIQIFTINLLAFLLPTTALAHDFEVDGIYYNIKGSDATVTYKGSSYDEYYDEYYGDVTIPESVTYDGVTYHVASIDKAAFADCSSLYSVTIGNSVTIIGDCAFRDCSGLMNITIPGSVTAIGKLAFYGCSSLVYIDIPNSVTSIGDETFSGCAELRSITIGYSVSSIGRQAFAGCNELSEIACHAPNPPQVDESVFENNCFFYTNLLVPGYSVDIYRNAEIWNSFHDILPLWFDLIVNGVYLRIEDDHAVVVGSYGKSYSGDMVIPSSVVSNGIAYPVTTIGDRSFEWCKRLTSILIPNTVTSIGFAAFIGTGLTSITVPNSVTTIGNVAFADCKELTCVTIPNSVTSIGYEAFACSGLTSIVIPSSVADIGVYAFTECEALQSMIVESDNPVYDSRNDCNAIIETASNTLLFGCQKTMIPNTVIAIGKSAFDSCTALKSIVIPNSVITIGKSAFDGCSGMTSLTIGNSVTTIENDAFYCCEALTDVYCHIADPTNVIKLEEEDDECEVFYSDYGNYAQRTLHVPAGSLDMYRSSEYWNPFFGQIVEMAEQSGSGDVNGDGAVNIGDVNQVINTILSGNQSDKDDVNKDGVVNISDVNLIINYILTH